MGPTPPGPVPAGPVPAGSPRPASSWDTPRPFRRGQPTLVVVGTVALAGTVLLSVLRVAQPSDDASALLASFIPAAALLAPLAVLCLGVALLRTRHRRALGGLSAAAALLTVLQVVWQAPLFVPDDRPATSATFTLLTLNTLAGAADPDQLLEAAAAADVVVLLEMTPAGQAALDARGLRTTFPYDAGASGYTVSNTVVFSRFPLSASERQSGGAFDQWATTVAVPDVGEVRLLAVHPCNPYCGGDRWASEHAALQSDVRRDLDGPLVVAGDFNAVDDHGPMQQLRRLGLRSATDLLGAGWVPTYPAGRWVPPLIPIDHVLVDDQLTTTSLARVAVDGTDHLGLRVQIGRAG